MTVYLSLTLSVVIVLVAAFVPTKGSCLGEIVFGSALISMPECLYFVVADNVNRFFEEINRSDSDYIQRQGNILEIEIPRQFRDLTVTPDDILENEKILIENFKEKYTEDGTVEEKTYITYQATDCAENVCVKNVTVDTDIDVGGILSNGCILPFSDYGKPVVIIYHTHSTEGYNPQDNGSFSTEYPERTDDIQLSVVRVGEEIAAVLKARGIGVIHDRTVYDSEYTGAYEKSRTAVLQLLEEYPSVVITIDVHRDAIHFDDTTRVKPVTEINGKKAAQIMIIAGAEGGNVESFPGWETNLSFALNLQSSVNTKYENLMKPVYFCNRKYNMDLTPYSFLAEIGTDMNTLSEAAYSGRLLGDALADFIKENVSNE